MWVFGWLCLIFIGVNVVSSQEPEFGSARVVFQVLFTNFSAQISEFSFTLPISFDFVY